MAGFAVVVAATALLRLAGHPAPQLADIAVGAVLLVSLVRSGLRHVAERAAWLSIAGAVALSLAGGAVAGALRSPSGHLPVPSGADALWLARYPLLVYALLALVRRRAASGSPRLSLLDAVIGAGAVAAIGAEVVAGPVLDADLTSWERAFTLAYPVGDLLVVGSLMGGVALAGWRVRGWVTLAAALACFATAESVDTISALGSGAGTGTGTTDPLYLAALVLFCLAAAQRRRPAAAVGDRDPRAAPARTVWLPALLAGVAMATLAQQLVGRPNAVTIACAFVSLGASVLRQGVLMHENAGLLRHARRDARTDALTGLANRRALTEDLDAAVAAAAPEAPRAVALLDLNGFKAYNDRFGHATGDALLARVASALRDVIGDRGLAYRMGGDEFCVLLDDAGSAAAIVADALGAVAESGQGFAINAEAGLATIPAEARTADAALRLADDRMYAGKARHHGERPAEVPLLALLRERDPGLGDHTHDVASLCVATAAELGADDGALAHARLGGELHDIGKMAVPDAILHKPGPLDETEWRFMRRHTEIGHRILSSDPALAEVALIARHHHERWDGGGYPDGLAGEAIPLLARVVAVCDAFEAMVTDRVYRPGRPHAEACAELRACAGTQFDPRVVAAFLRTVGTHAAGERPDLGDLAA